MDSQMVKNSNSGSTPEEIKQFRRKLPYDPAVLKRLKLWNKGTVSSKDIFGKMGSNDRDSVLGTLMTHQGDRKANPPDSKHAEGNTQKYNEPNRKWNDEGKTRSHGVRDNNGNSATDSSPSAGSSAVQYPLQPLGRGKRSLADARNGLKWNRDGRQSHAADGNKG